jgi:hypothetical protein
VRFLAQNIKNTNDFFTGAGKIYYNGEDLGLLRGGVTFSYTPTYTQQKGGSPQVTYNTILSDEEASIQAEMLEINPDMIAQIIPQFTKELDSSSTTSVTYEYLGALGTDTWKSSDHPSWTTATVTVKPASMLTAAVSAADTEISVDDASIFTAGDSVTLKDGETTENATIDAGGVDEIENTITLTAGVSNSYTTSGFVVDTTVAPVEDTDYDVDPVNGRIRRITASSVLDADTPVVVSYTYNVVSATNIYFGGKTTVFDYPLHFISDERPDGKYWHIYFWRAQFTSDGMDINFDPEEPTVLNVRFTALASGDYESGKTLGKWYLSSSSS